MMKCGARKALIVVLGVAAWLAPVARAEAATMVLGRYNVHAVGAADSPVQDTRSVAGTFLSDDVQRSNPLPGNIGYINYIVDVSRALVGSTCGAEAGVAGTTIYAANGRVQYATFQEGVTFTIPPGTYPDGVTGWLRGRAIANASSTLTGYADAQYRVEFPGVGLGGDTLLDSGLLVVGTDEESSIQAGGEFELSTLLIAPGTTIPVEQAVSFSLFASANNRCSTNTQGLGLADSHVHIQLIDMGTSEPDVTWESDSGVFLDHPAVPLLSPGARLGFMLVVLALGLLALLALSRREASAR